MHNIPDWLKYAMQDHLKLHLSSQEASDDEVLAIYPAAIRRRILQHLYLKCLTDCYLFEVCCAPWPEGKGRGLLHLAELRHTRPLHQAEPGHRALL